MAPTQAYQQEESGKYLPLSLKSADVTPDYMNVAGKGLFSTVYQGMYRRKECAIKVFNTETVRKDIVSESQLASIIRHHPNIVQVHGLWYGTHENHLPDDQPALVMELCSTSLWKYLKDKLSRGEDESFKLHPRLDILEDVTAAMIYLHSEEIVHGDLSAFNILLNISGSELVAKVTGFGQSGLLNSDTLQQITARHVRGDIMPPEVKDSQEQVELTKAVDVFSFGCLIPYVATCAAPDLRTNPLGW